ALESKYPAFGGISGIHVEPGGNRFIAVTDKGSWLRGRIIYRDGRPAGIADTEMAPILGQDGRPLATRGWYGTESLAERDGLVRNRAPGRRGRHSLRGHRAGRTDYSVRLSSRRIACSWATDQCAGRLQDPHIQQEPRMRRGAATGSVGGRIDRGFREEPRRG